MFPIKYKNAMKILNQENPEPQELRVSCHTTGEDFLQCLGFMSEKSLYMPKSNHGFSRPQWFVITQMCWENQPV